MPFFNFSRQPGKNVVIRVVENFIAICDVSSLKDVQAAPFPPNSLQTRFGTGGNTHGRLRLVKITSSTHLVRSSLRKITKISAQIILLPAPLAV